LGDRVELRDLRLRLAALRLLLRAVEIAHLKEIA